MISHELTVSHRGAVGTLGSRVSTWGEQKLQGLDRLLRAAVPLQEERALSRRARGLVWGQARAPVTSATRLRTRISCWGRAKRTSLRRRWVLLLACSQVFSVVDGCTASWRHFFLGAETSRAHGVFCAAQR